MSHHYRVANSNLEFHCVRCGRAFPRMYREDGHLVCKPGGTCRPVKHGPPK